MTSFSHYPLVPFFISLFVLHSDFLLANCSDVEAHRSSELVLTLLYDSCRRNPTGIQRGEGGGKARTKKGSRRVEEERSERKRAQDGRKEGGFRELSYAKINCNTHVLDKRFGKNVKDINIMNIFSSLITKSATDHEIRIICLVKQLKYIFIKQFFTLYCCFWLSK